MDNNVFDNSNIAESYAGTTTPLTFSFVQYVYQEVYQHFSKMALCEGFPSHQPYAYENWGDFFIDARTHGFHIELCGNWLLVRLTKHGTIEFRMFDASGDYSWILHIVETCLNLCKEAIRHG